MFCERTQQYYLGSVEHIPKRMLQGPKCIALAYPHVRSQFNYQKDYKLTTPNILYSILHEINDYKILTIPLEELAGFSNKMSRIVIAGRANIQEYTRNFTALGFCVHAMGDIWQIMLHATCHILPAEKSAWVIAVSDHSVYVFYFKNNSIYLHASFPHNKMEALFVAVDEFCKDFTHISIDAWCVGSLPAQVAQNFAARGLVLCNMPFVIELSFELFCCIGASNS